MAGNNTYFEGLVRSVRKPQIILLSKRERRVLGRGALSNELV